MVLPPGVVMDVLTEFPSRFYVNLGRRPDRRAGMIRGLGEVGLDAERVPAVDARWLEKRVGGKRRVTGGFDTAARYAVGMSIRMALRKAAMMKAAAVLIFEDDVVFSPDFEEAAAGLELPDDWGMFYFGCLHMTRARLIGDGIVRVARAVDTHAFAVRAPYYREIIKVLSPWGHRGAARLRNSDALISDLHESIPSYAAWPNLAWQAQDGASDITGLRNGNYTETGEQRCWADKGVPFGAEPLKELEVTTNEHE